MDNDFLDNLSERLTARLPSGLGSVREEIHQSFRAILSNAFSHLDLVNREEFEVQTALLRRTRERLESLERQVAALEAIQNNNPE
jgi:BMFP domain-containing protein YqiC